MNKLSFIIFISCVSLINSVPLENLCNKFRYKDVEINSIYRLKYNESLEEAGSYIISETTRFQNVFNDSAALNSMFQIRKYYNRKLSELYSDTYINGPGYNNIKGDYDVILSYFNNVKSHLNQFVIEHRQPFFNQLVIEKMKMGLDLAGFLQSSSENKFYFKDENNMNEMRSLFSSIKTEDDQIAGFKNDLLDEIFEKEILAKPHFILNRVNKAYYSVLNNGTFINEIIIPFQSNNKKSIDGNCVTKESLPKFYHQEKK